MKKEKKKRKNKEMKKVLKHENIRKNPKWI